MEFKSKTDFIAITPSRQVCMLAKQYDDAINLTIGDPDIATPKPICDAAYKAVLEGKTHYAPNAGIPELRQAICDFTERKKGVKYDVDQCVVTVGAVSAIYLSLMALVNPGDEVIIIPPYWSQYRNMTLLLGGKPVMVEKLDENLNPDKDALESLVTNHTKAIIMNNPNNPSGHIYPECVLRAVADIAVRHGLYVFADEVYDSLVYERPFVSMATFCPQENMLLFNSCSKSFAMTGWRVGFLLGPANFVKSVVKLQQNLVSSVPSMTQYAALEAFTHDDEYIPEIVDVFSKRRRVLIDNLCKVEKLKFATPDGTFYTFIDISATGLNSQEFVFGLLEKEYVALVPGYAYGIGFDKYVRLAYTQKESLLIEGVGRIKRFVESLI